MATNVLLFNSGSEIDYFGVGNERLPTGEQPRNAFLEVRRKSRFVGENTANHIQKESWVVAKVSIITRARIRCQARARSGDRTSKSVWTLWSPGKLLPWLAG